MLPSHIPDLSSESPLTVSGRFRGNFPEIFKVKGLSPDMSNIVIDLKVQDAKDIPLDRVRHWLMSLHLTLLLINLFESNLVEWICIFVNRVGNLVGYASSGMS